jgi:hypothetical protein
LGFLKKKEVHIGPFFIPYPKHAFETLTLVKRAKLGKLGLGLNELTNNSTSMVIYATTRSTSPSYNPSSLLTSIAIGAAITTLQ